MVKISPFQALRPTTSLVDKVITKTYSNYSRNEINKIFMIIYSYTVSNLLYNEKL